MFCMLLRKHIAGARIAAVEQPPYERVLLLRMEGQDELGVTARSTLAVELMGKGLNLVLVGEDGRILDCLRRVDYESGARRALLQGCSTACRPGQPKPGFFSLTPDQRRELLRRRGRMGIQSDGCWIPLAAYRLFCAGSWPWRAGLGWKRLWRLWRPGWRPGNWCR